MIKGASKVELESKVRDFIRHHKLISPKETLVVAVSGGADSVCLLHFLARWQGELAINLHIAHLNHQLRGAESEADALYVASLAEQLGIPVTIDREEVSAYKKEKRCSLEEAARELRYDFLARVAKEIKAERVVLGHTRDDQVETILMHILRGTGTFGLRGLEPCSSIPSKGHQTQLIRPLLDITREETANYCQLQRLEPRIDSSNLSLSFLRNRLRLELLPLLRKYNPNVDQALLRLAEIAKDDNSFIEQHAYQLWDEVVRHEDNAIHLDKRMICTLPIALQRQLIKLATGKALGDTRDIEACHIEAIRALLSKSAGKRISLPHKLVAQNRYNEIVIASAAKQSQFPPSPLPFLSSEGEFPLKVPGETLLPGWRVIAHIAPSIDDQNNVIASSAKQSPDEFLAYFDLEQARTELFIRRRKPGDRFQPLGMNLTKKLQDFMVDVKIPFPWRDHVPLVSSPKQIIWVVGWRIDDRVKLTEATKEILRLEFIRSS